MKFTKEIKIALVSIFGIVAECLLKRQCDVCGVF